MKSLISIALAALVTLPLLASDTDPYVREGGLGYVRFVMNGDTIALPVTSVGLKKSEMLFLELAAEGGRRSVAKVGLLLPVRGLYGGERAAIRLQSLFTAGRAELNEKFEVDRFERFSFTFDDGQGVFSRGTPDSSVNFRLGPAPTRISIDSVAFSLGVLEIWGSFDATFALTPVDSGATNDSLVIRDGAFKTVL